MLGSGAMSMHMTSEDGTIDFNGIGADDPAELMALGDQVVAETGSLLPGMQGGGLAVGRPIGGGGDAEMQKQMLLMMQGLLVLSGSL